MLSDVSMVQFKIALERFVCVCVCNGQAGPGPSERESENAQKYPSCCNYIEFSVPSTIVSWRNKTNANANSVLFISQT